MNLVRRTMNNTGSNKLEAYFRKIESRSQDDVMKQQNEYTYTHQTMYFTEFSQYILLGWADSDWLSTDNHLSSLLLSSFLLLPLSSQLAISSLLLINCRRLYFIVLLYPLSIIRAPLYMKSNSAASTNPKNSPNPPCSHQSNTRTSKIGWRWRGAQSFISITNCHRNFTKLDRLNSFPVLSWYSPLSLLEKELTLSYYRAPGIETNSLSIVLALASILPFIIIIIWKGEKGEGIRDSNSIPALLHTYLPPERVRMSWPSEVFKIYTTEHS